MHTQAETNEELSAAQKMRIRLVRIYGETALKQAEDNFLDDARIKVLIPQGSLITSQLEAGDDGTDDSYRLSVRDFNYIKRHALMSSFHYHADPAPGALANSAKSVTSAWENTIKIFLEEDRNVTDAQKHFYAISRASKQHGQQLQETISAKITFLPDPEL